MNRRYKIRSSDSGVALVITLIMLAVVTVMAIIFLAVTRRERLSVKLAEDQSTARTMADIGLERAKAEALANMIAGGTKLNYDLFNSRAFINPNGFDPALPTPNSNNVSYVDRNGRFLTGNSFLKMLGNLQYDPMAPVFVPTNSSGAVDFRFFLDFNRNRGFETNGFLPHLNTNGQPVNLAGQVLQPNNIGTNRFKFVGDPEWVGVLENPNQPHSETNKFIGRYAFIALPAGKTLDINFAHNQSNPNSDDRLNAPNSRNGFSRNQGYGSWEINLAAFLRELNTNNYAWHSNSYLHTNFQQNLQIFPRGDSFNDARSILDFRLAGRRSNLLPADVFLNEFRGDGIDNYGDDQNPLAPSDQGVNLEITSRPWPGSTNLLAFTDVQQLFTFGDPNNPYSTGFRDFSQRLQEPGSQKSSYDKYTFYRLLSQLGVDSMPHLKGKLHLNYENTPGTITNNIIPWTNAITFFTNAVDLMLQASMEKIVYPTNYRGNTLLITNYYIGDTIVRPDISSTNIQLWHIPPANQPHATSNEYTATIHRILQVAANIYDSTTNRPANPYPYFPTVFQPVFTKTSTNVFISGFLERTNAGWLTVNTWRSVEEFATDNTYQAGLVYTNLNLYGQPAVIGVKKGHPAFNEFSVESFVQMSRKMELRKASAGAPVTSTNQMLLLSLDNTYALEGWNSYRHDYTRRLQLVGEIQSLVTLSNLYQGVTNRVFLAPGVSIRTNWMISLNVITNWPGTTNIAQIAMNFQVPVYQNTNVIGDSAFNFINGTFVPENLGQFQDLFDFPHLKLHMTNRVRFWLVDLTYNKVVDLVSYDQLTSELDIGSLFKPRSSDTNLWGSGGISEAAFWATNRLGGPLSLTMGMSNQISASIGFSVLGDVDESQYDSFWRAWNRTPMSANERRLSIDNFRKFLGLDPIFNRLDVRRPQDLAYQTPFVPTRKFYMRDSWQVNDPFVRFMDTDLKRYRRIVGPRPPSFSSQQLSSQNSNVRRINDAHNPWGGGPAQGAANNTNAWRTTIKDPYLFSSDYWNFDVENSSSNYFRYPNIGYLGRVHRGTPWQTIYLKSSVEPTVGWVNWAGRPGTRPDWDRRFLEVFTVAPNENAARGLLSVNQTNYAAWSAVLSGIPVITFADARYEPSMPINYNIELVQPGSGEIKFIVDSINAWRASTNLIKYRYAVSNNVALALPYRPGFEHLGDVLGAPGLSDNSPYILKNFSTNHLQFGLDDRMAERLPQTILSLLARDEPRFVVYAFGQSLKPAPGSMETSAAYYGLIKNYQITGEVITKTTFRVEGELDDPAQPLRAVVESYEVLPPPE